MWMAFYQHSPEDAAFGFGNSSDEAVAALLVAYPKAAGHEIDFAEVFAGQGFSSLEKAIAYGVCTKGAAVAPKSPQGVPLGVFDRLGNPVHIGDRLRFDEKEWGGPCVFEIQLENGEIVHPGCPSDISSWCEVIEHWDGSVPVAKHEQSEQGAQNA